MPHQHGHRSSNVNKHGTLRMPVPPKATMGLEPHCRRPEAEPSFPSCWHDLACCNENLCCSSLPQAARVRRAAAAAQKPQTRKQTRRGRELHLTGTKGSGPRLQLPGLMAVHFRRRGSKVCLGSQHRKAEGTWAFESLLFQGQQGAEVCSDRLIGGARKTQGVGRSRGGECRWVLPPRRRLGAPVAAHREPWPPPWPRSSETRSQRPPRAFEAPTSEPRPKREKLAPTWKSPLGSPRPPSPSFPSSLLPTLPPGTIAGNKPAAAMDLSSTACTLGS